MIEVGVPGWKDLRLEHLVLDCNGTFALDGGLLPGVRERLEALAGRLTLHVVTADTFGRVRGETAGMPLSVTVLEPGDEAGRKAAFVDGLGAASTAAAGNGRNDRLMLEAAGLGIAVVGGEGAAREAILAADVVCTDIGAALDLLLHPDRIRATLRS